MSIVSITIILVSSLHVTSSFDDVHFDPFDCYRDLCTSRRQFCSHREQRCKECQQAHCLDPKTIPLQCSPLCAEWESRSTKGQTTRVITTLKTLSSGGYSLTTSSEDRNDSRYTGTETWEKGSVYSPRVLYAVVSGLVVVVVVLLALFTASLACLYRLHRRRCRHPASSYPGMEGRGEEGMTEEVEEQVLLEGGERCGSKSGTTGWTSSALPPRLGKAAVPRRSWHHQTKQESKSVQTNPILQPHLNPAGSADQPCLSERRDAVVQPAADGPASTSAGHSKDYCDCGKLPDPDHAEDGNDDGALPPPPPPPPRRPAYPASLRHVVEADCGQCDEARR